MSRGLEIRAPGERRPLPRDIETVFHLDGPHTAGISLHHNLNCLLPLAQEAAPAVQSALLTAIGVWAADKFLPRSTVPDAWTRDIRLTIPAAAQWAGLVPKLEALLNFLTGDRWQIRFRNAAFDLRFTGTWPHSWQPDAVVLFSGGLDSLAGALQMLNAGQRLLLVSHYDFGQLARIQQSLAHALITHFGAQNCHHLGLRLQIPLTRELTLRSRSLLYLTLGMTVAAAFHPRLPVVVPENGWISLNPPLTLNRLGTYSTRTTHPFTIEELTRLWLAAGIQHPVHNPFSSLSKGEILAQTGPREILPRLAPLTVSCARPVASRWQKAGAGACGYCYPCLLRRAAMHRVGLDDARHYRHDVLIDPALWSHRIKGSDLRALLLALQTWRRQPQELWSRLLVPDSVLEAAPSFLQVQRLLAAGFQEVEQWVRDQGGGKLWAYLR